MQRLVLLLAILMLGHVGDTAAASPVCDRSYVVRAGDTLSKIARAAFGNRNLWPYVYGYGANAKAIGGNPGLIAIGTTLRLPPCLQAPEARSTSVVDNDAASRSTETIEILTAGDYRPFTEQTWENGGMLTEVVRAAMDAADGAPDYGIDWINDWSAHIDPLLRRHKYDMGFPWFKPDCGTPDSLGEEDRKRCEFYFSDSLFDMLIVLFKRADDSTVLATDADLHGKRLCRPAGYFTFDLTARGLKPGETIELIQPQSVAECFHMLVDGQVDYVSMNQFTGQSVINQFDYGPYVEASEDLTDVQGLHLIVHRSHPNAAALLRQFNQGLSTLRANGRYDEIVGRHLAIYHGLNS